MILVDTNVLVALVLRRDALHRRAARDLEKHAAEELAVPAAVLCETSFLLARREQRARLRELLVGLRVRPSAEPPWGDVFAWLERYAEHEPDWADACLVALAGREHRVWTYDAEFRTVWRRADGHRVRLV